MYNVISVKSMGIIKTNAQSWNELEKEVGIMDLRRVQPVTEEILDLHGEAEAPVILIQVVLAYLHLEIRIEAQEKLEVLIESFQYVWTPTELWSGQLGKA